MTIQPQKLTTLDAVTRALSAKGISNPKELDKRMHTAAMLALVSASTAVMNEYVLPTPLFRLEYDPTAHNLKFAELHGRAPVPKRDAVDVSMLDLITAAMLRDRMSLLFEGITGVGKTHTTEMMFRTVLPPEHYCVLRLSAAMTNVQQPYVEGTVDNGVLKINLRRDALDRIGLMFVDEQNRGDTNQILQIKDGKISLASGESGYLGLPIPRLNGVSGALSWTLDHNEKRPLFVAAAQNPAGTKAAQYTGTRGTDGAVKNRDVEVTAPNAAAALGASMLRVKTDNGQHSAFMHLYADHLAHYLDIDKALLTDNVDKEIASWFAFATDPKRTRRDDLRSAAELSDVLALMFAPSLEAEYKHEGQVAEEWNTTLLSRRIDFKYTSPLDSSATVVDKIRKVVGSFAEQLVSRDLVKAKKLADALSLTRLIKRALNESDPVETYRASPTYITIEDVAAGYAIMAKDKQQTTQEDPVTVVDQVLRDYVSIVQDYATAMGYKKLGSGRSEFDANDPLYSVYAIAISHAVHATSQQGGIMAGVMSALGGSSSKTPSVDKFVQDLGSSVAVLRRAEGGSESKKPLIARMIADVGTLAGFMDQYAPQLEAAFAKNPKAEDRLRALQDVYTAIKARPSIPAIYLQRLPRVLGV